MWRRYMRPWSAHSALDGVRPVSVNSTEFMPLFPTAIFFPTSISIALISTPPIGSQHWRHRLFINIIARATASRTDWFSLNSALFFFNSECHFAFELIISNPLRCFSLCGNSHTKVCNASRPAWRHRYGQRIKCDVAYWRLLSAIKYGKENHHRVPSLS